MNLAPHLHVEWVEDEAVVLDPDTQQLHYLSPPAALAYALIGELGYDQGIEELRARHGKAPTFEGDLKALIKELTTRGILVT